MPNDKGELNPITPRQTLDFAPLIVFNRLFDGSQIGKVDTRAIDTFGELFQLHALVGGRWRGLGLKRQFDELTFLVVAGVNKGDSLWIGEGGRHMFWFWWVGVLDWTRTIMHN